MYTKTEKHMHTENINKEMQKAMVQVQGVDLNKLILCVFVFIGNKREVLLGVVFKDDDLVRILSLFSGKPMNV